MIQAISLYSSSGITKLGTEIWTNGEAIGLALNMRMVATPFGRWFCQFGSLNSVLTYITPWVESLVPFAFLLPFWNRRIRIAAVLVMLSLNVGIALTLNVGHFMFYATAVLTACLPKEFWDQLGLFKQKEPDTVDEPEKMPLPAMARVISSAFFGCLIFLITTVTFIDFHFSEKLLPYPKPVWTTIRGLEMYQNWGVFTKLNDTNVWFVAKANLKNGSTVDILQDGNAVVWDAQPGPPALFRRNSKWRVAFQKAYARRKNRKAINAFARSLIEHWNTGKSSKEQVDRLTLYLLRAKLDSLDKISYVKYLVWTRKPSKQ